MKLVENMLLELNTNETVRVVYCNRLSSILYVIQMDAMRWPYLISIDNILSGINEGSSHVIVNDRYQMNVIEDELSEAVKQRRDKTWEIVSCVLQQIDNESDIFTPKYREKAIRMALNVYRVNYSTVKNYLIRYWKGGKIRNGLLPYYSNCGSRGKERRSSEKKRGRPRKDADTLQKPS